MLIKVFREQLADKLEKENEVYDDNHHKYLLNNELNNELNYVSEPGARIPVH